MASKSNKTERVLSLITKGNKNDEQTDKDFEKYADTLNENGNSNISVEISSGFSEEENIQENQNNYSETTIKESSINQTDFLEHSINCIKNVKIVSSDDGLSNNIKKNLEDEVIKEQEVACKMENNSLNNNTDDKSFHYVNVMEQLVSQKIEKFMNDLGMCTCDRCKADVMALALSKLPAKYLVTDEVLITPSLNYYDVKFNAQIISAIMTACTLVIDRPKH